MSNNSARASRFLYTFLCRLCTTTTWHVQIFSWFEYRNGKAINFTLSPSLWTQKQSPQFSFNLTSFLSSNWVTWYKGEKNSKDVKSIFQWRFHWRRRCRIVRSLMSDIDLFCGKSTEIFKNNQGTHQKAGQLLWAWLLVALTHTLLSHP